MIGNTALGPFPARAGSLLLSVDHADIWLYDLLLTVICLIWRGQLRCDRPRWQRLAAAWHHFIRRDGVALRMLRSEAG